MAEQSVADLSYIRESTTTTSQNLGAQIKTSSSGAVASVELWQTLNNGGTRQYDRFNVGGTIAGSDTLVVGVTAAGVLNEYIHRVKAGQTITQVVADLVKRIELDDTVYVPSTTISGALGTVAVSAIVPGTTYTLSVAGGTGTTTLSGLTSVSTGSDTAATMHRQICKVDLSFGYSVEADERAQVIPVVNWYNGAASPVLSQSQSLSAVKHPISMSSIQSANGN